MLIQHDKRDQALSLRHIINMEKRIIGRILSFLELSISRELQADGSTFQVVRNDPPRKAPSSWPAARITVLHNLWTNLHKFCNSKTPGSLHKRILRNPSSIGTEKCFKNCGVYVGREFENALTSSSGKCCRKWWYIMKTSDEICQTARIFVGFSDIWCVEREKLRNHQIDSGNRLHWQTSGRRLWNQFQETYRIT